MHLLRHKRIFVKLVMILGTVLWVGALSPEILTKSGTGCILDENGIELTPEEAEDFMEQYFYGNADGQVEIRYKLGLLEVYDFFH